MDSDLPMPSIESEEPDGLLIRKRTANSGINSAANTPLPPSSPSKSPYKSGGTQNIPSSPRKQSRSPSAASSYSNERQTTPTLNTKRSNSNLNISRGQTPSRTQFRRTSSNLNPSSPGLPMKTPPSSLEAEKLVKVTAESVAKDYFRKELSLHSSRQSSVAVIVHDACYGHRFSRPRTSKAALNTIVERPERIHAAVLGASTAYIRIGGRHADGECAPHPDKDPSKLPSIPFYIRKTARSIPLDHPSVTHVHGAKWMEELQVMCDSAESKLMMNGRELVRPIGYGKDENGNTLPKLHEGDLYLCAQSLSALQGCLGGVCDAVDAVFGSSTIERAFVCIRPPGHHCSANFPSGFCWLNNVHVGIAYAAMNHGLTHAAIIDFDLHHGDGSQTIAWDHNRRAQDLPKNTAAHKKTPIGYYSLHDINSYPCEWGDEEKVRNASMCIENAHGQSIWNVHLEPWRSHEEFWKLYDSRYIMLLEKARIFLRHHTARLRSSGHTQPRAAIFLSAGFDASEWEGAGMQRHEVNVPTDFYARFTADCAKLAQEPDLSVDGRVISVLEGGYSDRALTSGVLSHICGLVEGTGRLEQGIVEKTASMTGSISNGVHLYQPHDEHNLKSSSYDSEWWASHQLAALESTTSSDLPRPQKSAKDKAPGTYSSPTHSSTAKMTDHARERRSLSSQLETRLSLESSPPPPPPDVNWIVASRELSKLIIPGDRQTRSCTHEELNKEALRTKKERQSTIGLPNGPDERMQLRDRRSKLPPPIPENVQSVARNSNRRTTIASVSELPDPNLDQSWEAVPEATRPRRRSSAASSILSSFQDMKLTDANKKDSAGPNAMSTPLSGPSSTAADHLSKQPGVKKSRAVTSKTAAKPRSSPKKAPATTNNASRRTSTSSEITGVNLSAIGGSSGSRPASRSRRQSLEMATKSDEMDSITTSMKKVSIKLKMPSAEEHAAKPKKADEEKPKKTRAPRKAPASKIPKTKNGMETNNVKPMASHGQTVGSESVKTTTAITSNTLPVLASEISALKNDCQPEVASIQIGVENSSPFDNLSALQLPLVDGNSTNPSIHEESSTVTEAKDPVAQNIHQAPTMELKDPVEKFEMLPRAVSPPKMPQQFITPSTAQMTQSGDLSKISNESRPMTPNKKSKQDLPVFTSQSPIPFAPRDMTQTVKAENEMHDQPKKDVESRPSIWDVPQTPYH